MALRWTLPPIICEANISDQLQTLEVIVGRSEKIIFKKNKKMKRGTQRDKKNARITSRTQPRGAKGSHSTSFLQISCVGIKSNACRFGMLVNL